MPRRPQAREHQDITVCDALPISDLWGDAPLLCEIECDDGFSLEDLMAVLGCLEFDALGFVQHGEVLPASSGPL